MKLEIITVHTVKNYGAACKHLPHKNYSNHMV